MKLRLVVIDDEEPQRRLLMEAVRNHPIVGYYGSLQALVCSNSIGSFPEAVDLAILDGLGNDGPKAYQLLREIGEKANHELHVVGWSSDARYIESPELLGDTFVPKGDLEQLLAHINKIAEIVSLARAQ